jgi:hypothetical protein
MKQVLFINGRIGTCPDKRIGFLLGSILGYATIDTRPVQQQ